MRNFPAPANYYYYDYVIVILSHSPQLVRTKCENIWAKVPMPSSPAKQFIYFNLLVN
jgi:hypothetical protein